MSPRIKELSLIRLVFWMPKKEILVSLEDIKARRKAVEDCKWARMAGTSWRQKSKGL